MRVTNIWLIHWSRDRTLETTLDRRALLTEVAAFEFEQQSVVITSQESRVGHPQQQIHLPPER